MKWGMVTCAYNGYERFISQWLEAIADLNTKPDKIVIAAGLKHFELSDKATSVPFEIHKIRAPYNMGKMRNEAVKRCETEWIFYLSVDDIVLPHAIDEFNEFDNADVIMIQWLTRGLGVPQAKHKSVTPRQNSLNRKRRRKGGFMIAQSPYRRKLWEQRPYKEHDLPNAPFFADMVEQGAKFINGRTPVTVYLRRPDSHARTELKKIKAQAVREKIAAEKRIDKYYANNK